MRVKTLEIRWHESTPIYALDYQVPAASIKKILAPRIQRDLGSSLSTPVVGSSAGHSNVDPAQVQPPSYRLATSGGDNNVRVWMVYPNVLLPAALATASSVAGQRPVPHPPRVEYLATLSKHTATVNVVRWSPNGEFIASAGDDGMIVVWSPSDRPSVSYGSDPSSDDTQYSKEYWRARLVLRCTTREVYDLAWSPNGDWIIAGSTDNTARIFNAADGTCVQEITDHSHYVQGVAWDPMNEFLATQSSDRSVHVYGINTKRGGCEVHPVGKNTKMPLRHTRTPSSSSLPAIQTPLSALPNLARRSSTASEADSAITSASEIKDEYHNYLPPSHVVPSSEISSDAALRAPLTPAASVISSASAMNPPKDSGPVSRSRRSSFSSVTNANSPALSTRNFGRSPSPMPPLPAIRTPLATPSWASVKLYGDEGFTNFFRRLTFSPDGALLLTPAGHFEDPHVVPNKPSNPSNKKDDPPIQSAKKPSGDGGPSSSSVFIYSRANFAKPPIAHLPGHKSASVAVRFSPVLYELRPNVVTPRSAADVKTIVLEAGKEQEVDLKIVPDVLTTIQSPPSVSTTPNLQVTNSAAYLPPPSPAPSTSSNRGRTPSREGHGNTAPPTTASVFALPYRMMYAVATQDTVVIYDTQQAGPICLFTNLHYAGFTDVAWAPDGQSLMLASADGYCSIVLFDDPLSLYHTQQHNMQMQAIANSISNPLHTHLVPSAHSSSATSTPLKRSEPPTPVEDLRPLPTTETSSSVTSEAHEDVNQPKKKKRRIQPTHHGSIN